MVRTLRVLPSAWVEGAVCTDHCREFFSGEPISKMIRARRRARNIRARAARHG